MAQALSPRIRRRLIRILVASLSAAAPMTAVELAKETPEIYRRELAAQLTPADKALAAAVSVAERQKSGSAGSVVLSEIVTWVAPDGRQVWVDHSIYRVNSQAAVEELERIKLGFRHKTQTLAIDLARTHLPDGKTVAVNPKAIFVQTPQDQADSAIYSDTAEALLIFPQVTVGAAIEFIAVYQYEPRIAGQYTSALFLGAGWPTDHERRTTELPAEMAARLEETRLGDAQLARRETLKKGRVRLTWEKRDLPGRPFEAGAPPIDQVGPAVFMSTLGSWEVFADWYRDLLAENDELPTDLANEVDEWTAGITDPAAIIETLHRRVADDIRYTGLEFGLASFQPKKPSEVWSDGYGDCKDKANLLRVMLARKGIRSYLALLNTNHAGRIETRSPDHRYFDHAILAIENNGRLLFADPTIAFLPAGLLGPGSSDRQVLVIKETGFNFVQTPAQPAGRISFELDLQVREIGPREGWIEFKTQGYYAASFRRYYEARDDAGKKQALQSWLERFFSEVEVIDFSLEGSSEFGGKAFVVVGAQDQPADAEALALPTGGLIHDEPQTDTETRRHSFFQTVETIAIKARYRLPPSWGPRALPEPLEIKTPALAVKAAWQCEESICAANLDYRQEKSLVVPEQFTGFAQALSATHGWLKRTPSLVANAETQAVPTMLNATTSGFEPQMPLLPSGEGQLRLVDRRFPASGDLRRRKAALEQVASYFPNDMATLFQVDIRLADLACDLEEPAAPDAFRSALTREHPGISYELRSWGEYLLAACAQTEKAESLAILRRLVQDVQLSKFRRGWSAVLLAKRLEVDNEQDEALLVVESGIASGDDVSKLELLALEAWLIARSSEDLLEPRLRQRLGETQGRDYLTRLLEEANNRAEVDFAPAIRLDEVVRKLAQGNSELEAALAGHASLQAQFDEQAVWRALGAQLRIAISAQEPKWWPEFLVEAKDQASLSRKVAELESDSSLRAFVRHAAELLTRYPPDEQFARRLFQIAWCLNRIDRDAPLIDEVLALLERLPKTDNNYWEGQMIAVERQLARTGAATAIKGYEKLLADPAIYENFRVPILIKVGRLHEQEGRKAAALATYLKLEADAPRLAGALSGLARAALILLEQGEVEKALALIKRFPVHAEANLEAINSAALVKDLIALARDEPFAREYWQAAAKWWPSWEKLARELKIPPSNEVPLIESHEALGEEIGEAQRAQRPESVLAAFDLMIRAARFQPRNVAELAGSFSFLLKAAPSSVRPLRAALIELFQQAPLKDAAEIATAKISLVALLIDQDLEDQAAMAIDAYLAEGPPEDDQYFRMLFLRAIVHTVQEKVSAQDVADLEKALAGGYSDTSRGNVVLLLAQVYSRLDRRPEELTLLERELEHAAVKESGQVQALRQRLEALRRADSEADELKVALLSWLEGLKLGWWDFVDLKSLEDPRIAGKSADEIEEDQRLLEPERLKAWLLIAAAQERPFEDRQVALNQALFKLSEILPLAPRRAAWQAVIADEKFPKAVRLFAYFILSVSAVEHSHESLESELEKHAFAAELLPQQQQLLEFLDELDQAVTAGPAAIALLADRLLDDGLNEKERLRFDDIFGNLLQSGDLAAAEKALARLEQVQLIDLDEQQAASFRLERKRELRARKREEAVFAVLRKVLLKNLDPAKLEEPAELDMLGNSAELICLKEETALRARLYLLNDRKLTSPLADEATEFLDDMPPKERAPIAAELAREAIIGLDEDEDLAAFLNAIEQSLDPASARPWLEALRAKAEPAHYPESAALLQRLQVAQTLLEGREVSWDAELDQSADSEEMGYLRHLRFLQILHQGNVKAARLELGRLSAAELTQAAGLGTRLRLARLSKLEEEIALIEKAARRQIYESTLRSWQLPTEIAWIHASRVFHLSGQLEGRPAYPPAWLEFWKNATQSEFLGSLIPLRDAELRQDWPTAQPLAAKLHKLEPGNISLAYSLGRAAAQNGDREVARRALGEVVKSGYGMLERAEAKAWLEQLGAP